MTEHLPRRRPKPCPAPDPELVARHRGDGDVLQIHGGCLLCPAVESTDWVAAALDGLRHLYPSADVVIGSVCRDCIESAEIIADNSVRYNPVGAHMARIRDAAHEVRNR